MIHRWSYWWLMGCLTLAALVGFYEMTVRVFQ